MTVKLLPDIQSGVEPPHFLSLLEYRNIDRSPPETLVSGGMKSAFFAVPTKKLTGSVTEGFLADREIAEAIQPESTRPDRQAAIPANARLTVPSPIPNSTAIAVQERPCARREMILAVSASTRGRPKIFPLARADASPDRTRSRISSRSNSAMVAKMPKISLPFWSAGIHPFVQTDEVDPQHPKPLQCVH